MTYYLTLDGSAIHEWEKQEDTSNRESTLCFSLLVHKVFAGEQWKASFYKGKWVHFMEDPDIHNY